MPLIEKPRLFDRPNLYTPGRFGLLLEHWYNGGAGGIAWDGSGNENKGIITGATWSGGYGLYLSGSGQYVEVADSNELDGMAALTVAVLIKIPIAAYGIDTIIAKWYATKAFQLNMNTNEVIEFETDADATVTSAGTVTIDDGLWHMYVGTYDGANQRLYTDGVQVDSDAQTGNITATANPLCIGALSNGVTRVTLGNFFIALAAVYNRALSAAEIQQLYANPKRFLGYEKVPIVFKAPVVGGLSIPIAAHHYKMLRAS